MESKYIGSVFDRQVRIQSWDQHKLSSLSALVLGVGGLGSGIVLNLLRLGVGRIFIVDYDEVDVHNLNRQLMFGLQDVGTRKVDALIRNSPHHNVGNSVIEAFHGNALAHWQQIVAFGRQSQIIFNCIDWGQSFDCAVASLCIALDLPLIAGGTFSTSATADYFAPAGKPCFACDLPGKKEYLLKIVPKIILQLQDITFLPRNDNPIGQSSVVVCTICIEFMVAHFLNHFFMHKLNEKIPGVQGPPPKAQRNLFYHNLFQMLSFDLESSPTCILCANPPSQIPIEQEQKKQLKQEHIKEEKQQ